MSENGRNWAAGVSRRRFLKAGAALSVIAAGPGINILVPSRGNAETAKVVIQYDWLMSNGQIGDVVAVDKGYFADEGIDRSGSARAINEFRDRGKQPLARDDLPGDTKGIVGKMGQKISEEITRGSAEQPEDVARHGSKKWLLSVTGHAMLHNGESRIAPSTISQTDADKLQAS